MFRRLDALPTRHGLTSTEWKTEREGIDEPRSPNRTMRCLRHVRTVRTDSPSWPALLACCDPRALSQEWTMIYERFSVARSKTGYINRY